MHFSTQDPQAKTFRFALVFVTVNAKEANANEVGVFFEFERIAVDDAFHANRALARMWEADHCFWFSFSRIQKRPL